MKNSVVYKYNTIEELVNDLPGKTYDKQIAQVKVEDLLDFLDKTDYRNINPYLISEIVFNIKEFFSIKKVNSDLYVLENEGLKVRHLMIFSELVLFLNPFLFKYFAWIKFFIPVSEKIFITKEKDFAKFCLFFQIKLTRNDKKLDK